MENGGNIIIIHSFEQSIFQNRKCNKFMMNTFYINMTMSEWGAYYLTLDKDKSKHTIDFFCDKYLQNTR